MGRGIGLALVAQAVHRLGGAVEVTNEVGAVFTVRLPRARPALAEAGQGCGRARGTGPDRRRRPAAGVDRMR